MSQLLQETVSLSNKNAESSQGARIFSDDTKVSIHGFKINNEIYGEMCDDLSKNKITSIFGKTNFVT